MTNWPAIFLALGWSGMLIECVRPGWVIPGVTGGVLFIYSASRLLPEHATLAATVSAPFIVIAAWMLAIGLRARRNKRTL